jgi:DnaJ-domain-containing protein 1
VKLLREAQKRLAKAVLRHKLQKQGAPPPPEAELDRQSERLVDEATRVLKTESKRMFEEVKSSYRQAMKKQGHKGPGTDSG